MDLHALLKNHITPWHAKLDQHPLLTPLMRPAFADSDYARALACLAPAQTRLEACVAQWGGTHPALAVFHPRTPALLHDLAHLGVQPSPAACALTALSAALQTRCRSDVFARFGVLYTLLGSNQGAHHLRQRVLSRPGPPLPVTYFSTQNSPQTPWADFLAWGNAACPSETQAHAAAETAALAFELVWAQLENRP